MVRHRVNAFTEHTINLKLINVIFYFFFYQRCPGTTSCFSTILFHGKHPEFQVRGSTEDNSKIVFLISQLKHRL